MSRPSLYKLEMHKTVLRLMSEGASKMEVAARLGINRDTIYEWSNQYPEFSDTIKKGELLSQAWWERQARTNLGNRQFNTALWIVNMRNRFRWDTKQQLHENEEMTENRRKLSAFLDTLKDEAYGTESPAP